MNRLQTDLELSRAEAQSVLSAWLGYPVNCTGIRRLHGGMVNTVLRLEFDRPPFSAVIKLNTGETDFAREALALDYLHAHTRFPCPRVYLQDGSASRTPYAFLLLETLPGESLDSLKLPSTDDDEIERQLAEVLLELHSHTRLTFGGINETPGQERWSDIFLARLLEVRHESAVEARLSPSVLEDVDYDIQLAETALQDQGIPTLIHGDIWDGNVIVRQENGRWRLSGMVDPDLHYADVEAELAYLEVFGSRRTAFFEAYNAYHPLRSGYPLRRWFYWLHTALVHVWLFGDGYYCEYLASTAKAIRNHFS
jgi:fructosamine-3-kinase